MSGLMDRPSGKRVLFSLLLASLIMLGVLSLSIRWLASAGLSVEPAHPQTSNLGRLPLSFEPNAGQTDPSTYFIAHASAGVLYFTHSGVVMSLTAGAKGGTNEQARHISVAQEKAAPASPGVVQLRFLDANPAPRIVSGSSLPGRVNYLLGNDHRRWHTGLPTYSDITYAGLYPGVDLNFTGSAKELEGTYTVKAGADTTRIRWRYEGADRVRVDQAGNLRIELQSPALTLTEQAPVAWQEIDGKRLPVSAHYSVSNDSTVGITLGNYDAKYPLVIDPTLAYSTYLGGSGADESYTIALDASGNIFVAGKTTSTNFPTQNPYQPANGGSLDGFISKLNAAGTALVYSTYLGGTGDDNIVSISVDGSNNAYVTGATSSGNFPTQNAVQPNYGGGAHDAFLTKLNASGSAPVYSTYLGGGGDDYGSYLALDGTGNLFAAGETGSLNFPTANPFQPFLRGTVDAFVSKLNAAGTTLVYSSYLGGTGSDEGFSVAVDGSGNAYLTGATTSPDLPRQNAFQLTYGGGPYDGFLTKFNPSGSGLVYSTFLGGTGGDVSEAVTVDADGNAYMYGYTNSTNFPTQNPIQSMLRGGYDMFVSKFNSAGSALVYSTYLGGNNDELMTPPHYSIAVDGQGQAYVTGGTRSTNFPTQNPIQPNIAGGMDAFVTKINAAGSAWVYSTYLGGSSDDGAYFIAIDGSDTAYVTGFTDSTNFPTQSPLQPMNAGGHDAFITKLMDPPPTPTGTPTNTPTNTPSATPTLCPITFTDVHPADYFYIPVRYLYCHNVISGYGDNTFRPSNNTTRGQLTKIVVLGYGIPIYAPPSPTFRDVPSSYAFYQYIETAYRAGLISGYGCGSGCLEFRPGNDVTRGQLCKIVVIAAQWSLRNPPIPTFRDVPTDDPFYPFIETAYCHGIISGYACGTGCLEFRPSISATRGQISKIVYESLVGGHACSGVVASGEWRVARTSDNSPLATRHSPLAK